MRIGIDASRAFIRQPTGTERYAYEVITRLLALPEAKKHKFLLYTRNTSSPAPLQSFGEGNVNIEIINIPMKYLWTQAGLAARTWTDGPDVMWIPAHTLPVLRRPGIKTVVTIHGIEYEWLPAYENRLQRWYLPWSTIYAVRQADKLITVSNFTKQEIMKRWGADEKKIEVVYEGIGEIPNFKTQARYKLKPKQYLLFVGTVQPRKNLVRLIEAFSRIAAQPLPNGNRDDNSLKLIIAGKPGWGYEEVYEAPKKYGIEGQVMFTGYLTDAERYGLLHNALVYVQPSITEGFGLPVLEAMQAGVPVVSSNGGALKEICDGAVLFDPFNVNEMAEAMQKTISDKKLREELVEKGRKRASDFSWDKTAKETLEILTNWP